jgi:glutamate-ammonia-ligase adenylyltransferase
MEISTLVRVLDQPHLAADQLHAWKLRDIQRGQQALSEMAECGLTLDLLASLCEQLGQQLPGLGDPDAVLAALRRYMFAARSPLALGALFDRDRSALPVLLRTLALGERWRELLIADGEAFDWLREWNGTLITREALVNAACAEIDSLADERAVAAALARMKLRQTLRIAYGEVYGGHDIDLVARQLSDRNEALIEAALRAAHRLAGQKGLPTSALGVVALGRLGAREADYGDALELLVLYEPLGTSAAARHASGVQAERLTKFMLRLLFEADGGRPVLRLKFAGLPDSAATSLTHTVDDVLLGFDSFGRTWHRHALVAARPVAGDRTLADEVLAQLEPWVFRRYLSRADETGIKSLGRRIMRRATSESGARNATNVQTALGGLNDLEGAVRFLQLLVGGEQPAVRVRGVLPAIDELHKAGALNTSQRVVLYETYVWLRRLLHRIQIINSAEFADLPTGRQLESVAGWLGQARGVDLEAEFSRRTRSAWEVISSLIQGSFPADSSSPAAELVLDPAPSSAQATSAISGYGFRDEQTAAMALHELAQEHIPFLSTRRCRHFLSLIAERLLQAVGATPDPDGTLADLARVSNSLGGKGVLWELCSFHPASLQLYVRLCAASPYLSGILTTNPGMIGAGRDTG